MLSLESIKQSLLKFDYMAAKFANKMLRKCGNLLTIFLRIYTTLGNNGFIFGVVMFIMFFFMSTRKAACLIFVAMFYGYIFTNIILKNTFARPRPYLNVGSKFQDWWKDAGCLGESGFSFPSGHTTAAMAFAVVMFWAFPKHLSWMFFFIPLVMAFSRVYFMVHYASDIMGALLVGAICGILGIITIHYALKIESLKLFFEFPSMDFIIKYYTKVHLI